MKKKKLCILLIICFVICNLKISSYGYSNEKETYYFEAEENINLNALSKGSINIVNEKEASMGKSLHIIKSNDETKDIPYVSLNANVTERGLYNLFVRTKEQNSNNTGISLSVNGKERKVYYANMSREYEWTCLCNIELNSGKNKIEIYPYHVGINLDKIIITNDFLYIPENFGTSNQKNTGLDIYGKMNFPKKNIHPRLFFNASDIPKIINNFNHPENKIQYDIIIQNANKNITDIFDKSKTEGYIESNALLYALYKNEENGRNAVDKLLLYLSDLDNTNSRENISRIYNEGVSLAAKVYDWCYDILSEQNKKDIIEKSMNYIVKSEFGFPCDSANAYIEGHEYEEKIFLTLLSLSVAVYDEIPDLYDYTAGRILFEFVPALNYHYENSSFHCQGDDYGNSRLLYPLYAKTIFDKLGVDSKISEKQKEMVYQVIYRKRPDGRSMGDGDRWTQSNADEYNTAAATFLAYNLYNDGYLKSAFLENNAVYKNTLNSYGQISPVLHLIINNIKIDKKNISELPKVRYMGNESGMYTIRTSWDKDAMVISMKVPERNFLGHAQLDAGNFEIFYKDALATDSGVYNGITKDGKISAYGSPHDINYNKRTIAHNCMLIYDPLETNFGIGTENDGGQRVLQKLSYTTATFDDFKNFNKIGKVIHHDDKIIGDKILYTYLKGDITNAYSSSKLKEYKRTFVFTELDNIDSPGALIVFDKVVSKNPKFKKTWLLHTKNEPKINGNIISSSIDNKATLYNQTLLPEKVVYNNVEGFNVNGKIYESEIISSDKRFDESGKWRTEVSPVNQSDTDYFLNVLTVSDNKQSGPVQSKVYDLGDYYKVEIENKVILLSKDNKDIKNINVDIDNNKDIIVTGLTEGQWTVKNTDKGQVDFIRYIDNESGSMHFKGNKGSYVIYKEDTIPVITSKEVFSEELLNDFLEMNKKGKLSVPDNSYVVLSANVNNKTAGVKEFGFVISSQDKIPDINSNNSVKVPVKEKNLTGNYILMLKGIKPEVTYYYRAYALLNDNIYTYGNTEKYKTSSGLNKWLSEFGKDYNEKYLTLWCIEK